MRLQIWRFPDKAGFKQVWIPSLVSDSVLPYCSRWKPVRTTISGEAWNNLAYHASVYQISIRELLERMIHHGLSGLNRPGSWEANSPFDTDLYGPDGVADRWFQ